MACDISAGRLEPCKDNVGGLDAIYFVNYDDLPSTQITLDVDDQVTAIGGTPTAYKYELKGTSNLETAITSSRDNGTTFFDAVLNIMLKKQDLGTHKEVKLLSWGRPKIFVKDNNNNYFLVGYEHGADVNGGSIVTGAAFGDMAGYNLTFQAMEKLPHLFVNATSDQTLANLGMNIQLGDGSTITPIP
jgi:hypothetical protein